MRKADRYWPEPEDGAVAIGQLSVECIDTQQQPPQQLRQTAAAAASSSSDPTSSSSHLRCLLPSACRASGCSDCVLRRFRVLHAGRERVVQQLQFLAWPDHGVPLELSALASFFTVYRQARQAARSSSPSSPPPPVLVHCSAGIGRTGTFCTIDLCLDSLAHGRDVSVLNTVRLLRLSRPGMVQTRQQYALCYAFIDHCIQHSLFGCSASPAGQGEEDEEDEEQEEQEEEPSGGAQAAGAGRRQQRQRARERLRLSGA